MKKIIVECLAKEHLKYLSLFNDFYGSRELDEEVRNNIYDKLFKEYGTIGILDPINAYIYSEIHMHKNIIVLNRILNDTFVEFRMKIKDSYFSFIINIYLKRFIIKFEDKVIRKYDITKYAYVLDEIEKRIKFDKNFWGDHHEK